LQINEFMPLLAYALLDSIAMLDAACRALTRHVGGITADAERCAGYLANSPTLITAFLPKIGYDRAEALVKDYAAARASDPALTLRAFLSQKLGQAMVDEVLAAPNLIKLGHTES